MKITDELIEEIRREERERIAKIASEAACDAVPQEAIDYQNGVKDGVAFMLERILAETKPAAARPRVRQSG